MRFQPARLALAALCVAAIAGPASAAATLLHAYDFANTGGATAIDLVGSANGTLTGDAAITGGVLNLDGFGDTVTFGEQLIPFGGEFSVFIRARLDQPVNTYGEIIAQGASGGPGFYIGSAGNNYRLSDAYGAPGLTFHNDSGFHDLLLTNGGGAFTYSIDGVTVFTNAQASFGGACNTVIGDQFCGGFNEYFKGAIDTVKIYSGVATYAEASAGLTAGAVPEPASWAMMILGFGAAGAMLRRQARGQGGRMIPAVV